MFKSLKSYVLDHLENFLITVILFSGRSVSLADIRLALARLPWIPI
jgi:hypothetical protein